MNQAQESVEQSNSKRYTPPNIHVEAKGLWSSFVRFLNTPTGKTAMMAGGALIGIAIVNRKVKYVRQKSALKETLDKGSAENIAMRIRKAMGIVAWGGLVDWDGTDEAEIVKAVSEIENQEEWQKVIRAYGRLTQGKILAEDLERELSQYYLDKISHVLENKPKNKNSTFPDNSKKLAGKLKDAVEYTWFGISDTDIDKIFDVFYAIPNKTIWTKVKQEYRKISYTGKELWQDLENENRLKNSFNSWTMFTSASSNYYQNSSKTIVDILKDLAIERFGEL